MPPIADSIRSDRHLRSGYCGLFLHVPSSGRCGGRVVASLVLCRAPSGPSADRGQQMTRPPLARPRASGLRRQRPAACSAMPRDLARSRPRAAWLPSADRATDGGEEGRPPGSDGRLRGVPRGARGCRRRPQAARPEVVRSRRRDRLLADGRPRRRGGDVRPVPQDRLVPRLRARSAAPATRTATTRRSAPTAWRATLRASPSATLSRRSTRAASSRSRESTSRCRARPAT